MPHGGAPGRQGARSPIASRHPRAACGAHAARPNPPSAAGRAVREAERAALTFRRPTTRQHGPK
eukprot:168865-Pyramimonas_sp.AAC.1